MPQAFRWLIGVPTGILDQGSRTPEEGGCSEGDQVQDQAGDRAGTDTLGLRSRLAAWRLIDGYGLRQWLAATRGHDCLGRALCGLAEHLDLATGTGHGARTGR